MSTKLSQMFKKLPIDENAKRILESSGPYIPKDSLSLLFKHEIGCILVRNFYPQSLINGLVTDIENIVENSSSLISNWRISQSDGKLKPSEVDTIGIPLNVAKGNGTLDEYYATSLDSIRRFRGVHGERLTPIDKLRLELDELHKFGCQVGREDSQIRRLNSAGLFRIMKRSHTKGLIHMDDVGEISTKIGVFSANIYLQTSLVGGEVEIYPITFRTKKDLMDHALEIGLLTSFSGEMEAQRVLREYILPGNPLVVKPQAGDLLLMCVQRPHAVRGPIHGPKLRINAQCFILHEENQPLRVEV
jgi:hypothetical protein